MRRLEALRAAEPHRAGSCPFLAQRARTRERRPLDSRSRSTSECPPLPLLRDVFARPHREREYGPRWILVRLRDERAAISNEKVLDVMRTTICIEHGL